jgi:hypothetical protein
MDIHVYSEHPVADLWTFTSILNTRLPTFGLCLYIGLNSLCFTYVPIDLCQFLVFYVGSYRSVSIPRVSRLSYGLCWGPPHDGQKSVPSELQEARFAD